MVDDALQIDNVRVPRFIYGTAWKEAETERLVALALARGFRGIDTANQRRHYFEAGVGAGLQRAFADGRLARDDVFLQTKFTFRRSQDHRLPYDPDAPVPVQVGQSIAASLEHLGVDSVDSLVLHGPSAPGGLAEADLHAWRAMEKAQADGKARLLGISNVSLDQLRALCDIAHATPRFVQNRCYAARGWDRDIRAFCAGHGIVYQGFSLLTANAQVLAHPALRQIAGRHGRTPAQVVFRFALDAGMIPLTGTRSEVHMREDRAIFDFALHPDEVRLIEGIGRAPGGVGASVGPR